MLGRDYQKHRRFYQSIILFTQDWGSRKTDKFQETLGLAISSSIVDSLALLPNLLGGDFKDWIESPAILVEKVDCSYLVTS